MEVSGIGAERSVIKVLDTIGKEVMRMQNGIPANVMSLPKGIYFVEIHIDETKVRTGRFIKS